MPSKAQKEQVPQLLSELVNRENNADTLKLIQRFLNAVQVNGQDVIDCARCLKWVEGVIKGEETRMKEIRGLLPDKDEVIDMTKSPASPEAPPVSQGAVEIQKGEPVLGQA